MFGRILRFELAYQLRQPAAWATAGGMSLLMFLAMAIEQVQVGGGQGNLDLNASMAILVGTLMMSWFALFLAPILVARVALRDRDEAMAELIGVTPVSRLSLQAGRFVGAYVAALAVFATILPAGFAGTVVPWLPAEEVGPHRLAPWLYGLGVVLIPNLLIASAFTFIVAALTRSMLMTYIAVVALMLGSIVAQAAGDHVDWGAFAAMTDPFGIEAVFEATRYWSVAEQNAKLPALEGVLLQNRLLWLGIAIVLAGAGVIRAARPDTRERGRSVRTADPPARSATPPERPRRELASGASLALSQLAARSRLEFLSIIKSLPFVVLLVLGAVNIAANAAFSLDAVWDAPVIPDTPLMLRIISDGFALFLILAIIYYAGELVWREERAGMDGIIHALPVPGWVFVVSKMVAMVAMIATMLAVAAVVAIGFQLVHGHTAIRPGLYVTGLLVQDAWPWFLYGALAVFLQVVSGHRFIGMLLLVVVFISQFGIHQAGFEHHLWSFGTMPDTEWSVFFGFDHMLEARLWYGLFWTLVAGALLFAAHALWTRHSGERLFARARAAVTAADRRAWAVLGATAVLLGAVGGWIVYNTTVLNHYETSDDEDARAVAYEERWLGERDRPQPEIKRISGRIDVFPEVRAYRADTEILLENPHEEPLEELHLTLPADVEVYELRIDDGEILEHDEETAYVRLELSPTMDPGDSRTLRSELGFESAGFTDSPVMPTLVENGTYLLNANLIPTVGFDDRRMLTDRRDRRRHGLDERPRRPDLDDESEHGRTYLTGDAHWIHLELTVSTAPGQRVVVPAQEVDRWEEDGRPVFEFRTEAPIQNFFGVLSGDMDVVEAEHAGRTLRIIHHPGHADNVDHMLEWSKDSLDLFEDIFTPYQWDRFDIIEIPATVPFAAQALPHTVPFAEDGGFRADTSAAEPLDFLGFVVAHEIAHMWWAHQVTSANVQGAEVLTETLADYSALLALEERFGADELEGAMERRLDEYLQGRGAERMEEMPLFRSEGQAYIHYQKGGQVMYALRHYLGRARVNAALRSVLDDWAFEGPPYATSRVVLEALLDQADDDFERELIEDMFKRIILFEFRAHAATAGEAADGWRVELDLEARRLEDDGHGNTEPISMDMPVEIAGYDDEGEVIGRGFFDLTSGEQTVEISYAERPAEVAIDPLRLLPNRRPDAARVGVD